MPRAHDPTGPDFWTKIWISLDKQLVNNSGSIRPFQLKLGHLQAHAISIVARYRFERGGTAGRLSSILVYSKRWSSFGTPQIILTEESVIFFSRLLHSVVCNFGGWISLQLFRSPLNIPIPFGDH
jgi:hypothetical protein